MQHVATSSTTSPIDPVTRRSTSLPSTSGWSGTFALILLLVFAALLLSACNPELEDQNFADVNALRSSLGVTELTRSSELNFKAQLQAEQVAAAAKLSHSSDLGDGVTGTWRSIGENVASAGSVEAAQAGLVASAGHYANLVNPEFSEMGVGVVVRDGTVYLVQVFVGR